MKPTYLVLTCEHAGNKVPAATTAAFASPAARRALASHRGIDLGAAKLFRAVAPHAGFSLAAKTSRLVVELNRSLHHPHLFSEFTRPLPASTRQHLLDTVYLPYRSAVESAIASAIQSGHTVLHLSVHTFTPTLHGVPRNADLALLYDPARPGEKHLATRWLESLTKTPPTSPWHLRRNYPYRGTADGFTTHLRRLHPPHAYLGIELEVNNTHAFPRLLPGLAQRLRKLFTM